MNKPNQIKICHGRVCGESNPERLRDTLAAKFQDSKISFCECTGYCEQGPNVIADGKIYHHSKPRDVAERIEAGTGATLSEIDIDDILGDELF